MKLIFSKRFKKEYKKLSARDQKRVGVRLSIFTADLSNPQLNNHKLHGRDKAYWSINISGDLRAVFEEIDPQTYFFIKLGTHSQLYKQ